MVCREFPGLWSAQMDVGQVLACVDSVMTTSLLSEYIACDNDVDAIADIIQGRVVAWVVQLETMLQLCKPSAKKPSCVSGYVIGIAKQLMKIQKEHQKQTNLLNLPDPDDDWEPSLNVTDS